MLMGSAVLGTWYLKYVAILDDYKYFQAAF